MCSSIRARNFSRRAAYPSRVCRSAWVSFFIGCGTRGGLAALRCRRPAAAASADALDTYNPLIPDGSNWKATFMIEYADPKERAAALAELVGIENRVWLQVQGEERVWAIADEDLERATPEKTSSVHFLRFELTPAMAAAVIDGADVDAGVDHANYRHLVSPIGPDIRASLAGDLD